MRIFTQLKKGALMTAAALALLASDAQAITYTATTNGNFSSGLTWQGGIVPPALLGLNDQITINSGVNVNMDVNVMVASGNTLNVMGTLTSVNNTTLELMGGTLSGTGTIDVDSLVTDFTSNFNFTGGLEARAMNSMDAAITSAANITINELLNLTDGTMAMTAGTLSLDNNTTIIVDGGTMTVGGSGSIVATGTYDVMYVNSSANSGAELTIASGLTNVTINPGANNSVTLTDDVTINGDLNLMSGEMVIGANELTLNGSADVTGMGTITGSSTSDLMIMTTGSLTNPLMFTAGSEMLDNLSLDLGSPTAMVELGNDLTINSDLELTTGMLDIGSNELTIAPGGDISTASTSSFVVTDGGGMLTMNVLAGDDAGFAVGTSSGFMPAIISAASGSASSNISVSVQNGVMAMGTTGSDLSLTQPMVNSTWFIESDASSNLNLDMEFAWDMQNEVNSFDRNQVFISHFTNGMWDTDAAGAAGSSGSLFTASRTGITSLSPFAVFDANTAVSVEDVVDNSTDLNVYPNPATSEVNITYAGNEDNVQLSIYNVTGQLAKTATIDGNATTVDVSDLTSGVYYIRLNGEGTVATQKFVKQ